MGWRIFQAIICGGFLYLAYRAAVEGQPLSCVIGTIFVAFLMPIALTVAWVLIYEVFLLLTVRCCPAFRSATGRPAPDVEKPQRHILGPIGGGSGEFLEDLRPPGNSVHRIVHIIVDPHGQNSRGA